MNFELNNKVALVTGGSRGIGRSVALSLAAQGMHVAICGRSRDSLEQTAGEIEALGVKCWAIQSDVSQHDAIESLVAKTVSDAGGIDVLVNNAVSSTSAPFNELDDDLFRYHIDVKLMAYIRTSRLVLPVMQKRGGGRIVNVGGMTARVVAPLRMTNGVVNAGVANFTKQFAGYAAQPAKSVNAEAIAETADTTVTVNCVHPGFTRTERVQQIFESEARQSGDTVDAVIARRTAEIPLGKLVQPEDIADAVLFFCSPLARMITGQSIAVDGGSGSSINY